MEFCVKKIIIIDIKPGFVDTKMAQGEGLFWIASTQKAASQIASIIRKRKKHAYVTKRWGLIALLLRIMPGWLYKNI